MDQSTDPAIQRLTKDTALLMRIEEAMIDALAEAVASARQAGDVAKAARMEEFIRQHRVSLLERQAQLASVDPET